MTSDAEPRVDLECVLRYLERVARPYRDDRGRKRYEPDTVEVLAERASVSTRTIYRVLARQYPDTIELDLADRLLLAAGYMLFDCDEAVRG